MGFVAPSLLLGLVAAGLPYLIHLIGKRRARPVKFAAMQLLMGAERRVSARRRLRELLLLLIRTAMAAALPLVFARPYTERASDAPMAAMRMQSAVLLLDDSASMMRGGSLVENTLFDVARAKARAIIRQLPSSSVIAIVLACEGSAAPVPELTADKGRLLEALDRTQATARPADFAAAMRRASLILTGAPHAERRIFVLTDMQATGWEGGTGLPPTGAPEAVMVDVSAGRPWQNRAVVQVSAELVPEQGPGGIAVTAEVADFGGRAPAAVATSLLIDGNVVAKGTVDLAPNGRARKRFVHTLPAEEAGVHQVEVALERDDFPLDDRRFTRVAIARSSRTLIVNGDAKTVRTEDETFFLESALRQSDSGALVNTVLPDEASPDGLDRYGVVFFANVSAPSPALGKALVGFVRRGGGLFVSVGDKVDAALWNERVGEVLPQPMGLVRTASAGPGASVGELMDERPAERLAPLDRRHALLAQFTSTGEGIASARFFKFMLLEPIPDDAGRSVILRFESGSPALVERAVGKGRVLLLASTVDRAWTDLPIRPGFLPLMLEANRRLGGAPDREQTAQLLVGQPRRLLFAQGERRLEVIKPGGEPWAAHQSSTEQGKELTFTETAQPGVYRVRTFDAAGAGTERDAFVVNLDSRESDTALVAADHRPDRAATTKAPGDAPKQKVELWHGLAMALVFLVLGESVLTMRRRFRAEAA